MAKINTPFSETIKISRRWFPWSRLVNDESLQESNLPYSMRSVLLKPHTVDWLLTFFIALIYFAVFSYSVLYFIILMALTLAAYSVKMLGLTWIIEISTENRLVKTEKSDGFLYTSTKMQKIGELYHSGSMKLPASKYLSVEPEEEPIKSPKVKRSKENSNLQEREKDEPVKKLKKQTKPKKIEAEFEPEPEHDIVEYDEIELPGPSADFPKIHDFSDDGDAMDDFDFDKEQTVDSEAEDVGLLSNFGEVDFDERDRQISSIKTPSRTVNNGTSEEESILRKVIEDAKRDHPELFAKKKKQKHNRS